MAGVTGIFCEYNTSVLYYLHRTQCNDSCIEALNDTLLYEWAKNVEGWTGCQKVGARECWYYWPGMTLRILWARLSEELQFSGEAMLTLRNSGTKGCVRLRGDSYLFRCLAIVPSPPLFLLLPANINTSIVHSTLFIKFITWETHEKQYIYYNGKPCPYLC